MESNVEYIIPFTGLKVGIHEFEFDLDGVFFEHFDYSEIGKCAINIKVSLDRKEHMMVFEFDISGKAEVLCDRCQEEVEIELAHVDQLVVKFGDQTSDFEEEIIILGPHEHQFDLTQFLFEFCHLALPPRRVHDTMEECNQDVIEVLNGMSLEEDDNDNEIDPRWAALKNIADNE